MEMFSDRLSPELPSEAEAIFEAIDGRLRPMKRAEFEQLDKLGFFDEEKVELLFGLVIPMAPIDQEHSESVAIVHDMLFRKLDGVARVYTQASFAASEYSAPQPDIFVVPPGQYWQELHSKAYLIVEVSRSSLRRDRAKRLVYQGANVDEYWIVNHPDACVEVYRDRRDNKWHSLTKHFRGDVISPLAFPDVQIAVADILPPA
jgi:Uma2 family endonuclease